MRSTPAPDDLAARRVRLAGAAADVAIEELRDRLVEAIMDFTAAVAPQVTGAARLRLAVTSLRAMANGLEADGAALLHEVRGG